VRVRSGAALLVLGALAACSARSEQRALATAPRALTAQGATLLGALAARFPAPNAPSVCADVPLRLSFKAPVRLGDSGKIQVFKASAPHEPVDSVDLSAVDYTNDVGGRPFHAVRPVFVEGSDVVVQLRSRALAPSETYFVTIEPGVFLSEAGLSLGELTAPSGWRFTTRPLAPANPAALSVALDGSGDFCSVQGALDFLPDNSATPATISVKNGVYHEIVFISNKRKLTLRGEDRKRTVIAYANSDNLQQRLGTRFRALVHVENTSELVIENLTLHNLTSQQPPGGAGYQAEALRVDPGTRVVLRNADVISRQDTLLLSGSVYVVDSTIEGNVDFIWGKGTAYFERTELRTVGRPGYLVQSRNPPGRYGYVFVDSKLTAQEGIIGTFLARIDANEYPGSNVAFVNCELGPHITPEGWLITPQGVSSAKELRFWEYQSVDADRKPVDVSQRSPLSRQLSEAEARSLRDKVTVLGWDPSAP
jgi:pectin methylesterase-like acyl-CoA thioesterase